MSFGDGNLHERVEQLERENAELREKLQEIVRCRDCIKFGKYGKTAKAHWCGYWACYKAKPDGFCAWGERKERKAVEVWEPWIVDDVTCGGES